MAYPFSLFRGATTVTLADHTTSPVELPHVGPGYFDLTGAKLVSGRAFETSDAAPPPLFTVINRSLAEAVSRDGLPARTVDIGGLPHEVIGVVDDVRMWRPDLAAGLQAYVSTNQRRAPASAIVVRTNSESASAGALAAALQTVWPSQPVRVEVLSDTLNRLTAPQRTRAALLSALAVVGLLLTLAALAGGLVESVRSRGREVALRVALGAAPPRLVRGIVGEAVGVVVAGLAFGLPLGVAAQKMLPELFSLVGATDVRSIVAVAMTLLIVALVGSARAAFLACAVDPATALGAE